MIVRAFAFIGITFLVTMAVAMAVAAIVKFIAAVVQRKPKPPQEGPVLPPGNSGVQGVKP